MTTPFISFDTWWGFVLFVLITRWLADVSWWAIEKAIKKVRHVA